VIAAAPDRRRAQPRSRAGPSRSLMPGGRFRRQQRVVRRRDRQRADGREIGEEAVIGCIFGCRRQCQGQFRFTTLDLTLTDHAPARLVLENLLGFRLLDGRLA